MSSAKVTLGQVAKHKRRWIEILSDIIFYAQCAVLFGIFCFFAYEGFVWCLCSHELLLSQAK